VTKTRTLNLSAVLVLAAGLLAAAAVWAGVSLAGGSGTAEPSGSQGGGGFSFVQDGGDQRGEGRDCPKRDGSAPSDAADSSV
jgi:hypothetical protein